MSHTVSPPNGNLFEFAMLTIVNYTAGGEPVSASDVGVNGVDGVFMSPVGTTNNSLGSILFPLLSAGKILLFRFVAGAPVEIPTTVALNALIPVIVHVSLA